MTREFPDELQNNEPHSNELHSNELLSAFLDDELSPAERAQVEHHLAANPADRQLLAELKSLRGEVASLPTPSISPDFADRVIQAAIAEAEKHNGARGVVSRAPPEERHFWRRWRFRAAAASAAALAACLLLVVLLGGRQNGPEPGAVVPLAQLPETPAAAVAAVAALPEQFVAALSGHLPGDHEAIVLRLKADKNMPVAEALDAALAAAGLKPTAAAGVASAAILEEAYQNSVASNSDEASVAAAEAVFIDAPYERLQSVVDQLAASFKDPPRLESAGKLALGRAWVESRPEGEAAAAPFVQHLNAGLFKLQKTISDTAQSVAKAPPAAVIDPQQRCRVLILVEPGE